MKLVARCRHCLWNHEARNQWHPEEAVAETREQMDVHELIHPGGPVLDRSVLDVIEPKGKR